MAEDEEDGKLSRVDNGPLNKGETDVFNSCILVLELLKESISFVSSNKLCPMCKSNY